MGSHSVSHHPPSEWARGWGSTDVPEGQEQVSQGLRPGQDTVSRDGVPQCESPPSVGVGQGVGLHIKRRLFYVEPHPLAHSDGGW